MVRGTLQLGSGRLSRHRLEGCGAVERQGLVVFCQQPAGRLGGVELECRGQCFCSRQQTYCREASLAGEHLRQRRCSAAPGGSSDRHLGRGHRRGQGRHACRKTWPCLPHGRRGLRRPQGAAETEEACTSRGLCGRRPEGRRGCTRWASLDMRAEAAFQPGGQGCFRQPRGHPEAGGLRAAARASAQRGAGTAASIARWTGTQ